MAEEIKFEENTGKTAIQKHTKQCKASGQQYSVFPQGVLHGDPGITHIFVIGQQACPVEHTLGLFAHDTFVGVKQRATSINKHDEDRVSSKTITRKPGHLFHTGTAVL